MPVAGDGLVPFRALAPRSETLLDSHCRLRMVRVMRQYPSRVRVTHRFHPLFGRALEFVNRRKNWQPMWSMSMVSVASCCLACGVD